MANLLVTPSVHDLFLAEDGLKSLFRIARVPDDACHYNGALCYRNLSATRASHAGIVNDGGLTPLMELCMVRAGMCVCVRAVTCCPCVAVLCVTCATVQIV